MCVCVCEGGGGDVMKEYVHVSQVLTNQLLGNSSYRIPSRVNNYQYDLNTTTGLHCVNIHIFLKWKIYTYGFTCPYWLHVKSSHIVCIRLYQ